jgi:cytochrome c
MVKLYACVACFCVASFAVVQPVPPIVTPPQKVVSAVVEMGRAIAFEKCQSCHAAGPTGPSANPRAPPLRTLSQKYPIDTLSEAFAEGVLVGHTEMPEFELEPAQVDALMTYIESIQTDAGGGAESKSKSGQ